MRLCSSLTRSLELTDCAALELFSGGTMAGLFLQFTAIAPSLLYMFTHSLSRRPAILGIAFAPNAAAFFCKVERIRTTALQRTGRLIASLDGALNRSKNQQRQENKGRKNGTEKTR